MSKKLTGVVINLGILACIWYGANGVTWCWNIFKFVGRFKLEPVLKEGQLISKNDNHIKQCAVCLEKFWYGGGYKALAWNSYYLVGGQGLDDGFYALTAWVCSENCFDLFCLSQI